MFPTNGTILTNAGIGLLAKSLSNSTPIIFTTAKIGTGDLDNMNQAKQLRDLKKSYKIIGITSISRNKSELIKVRASYTNKDLIESIQIKEIGIFAKIAEEPEVLMAYVNDGIGELIPPGNTGNVIERIRDLYIGITEETKVMATIDNSLVYATIYDLEEGLNKKSNIGHIHPNATVTVSGFMSFTDKEKIDGIERGANNYKLPVATTTVLGAIKVGNNLAISNGVLNAIVAPYDLPLATSTQLGGIKSGFSTTFDGEYLETCDAFLNTSGNPGTIAIGSATLIKTGLRTVNDSIFRVDVTSIIEDSISQSMTNGDIFTITGKYNQKSKTFMNCKLVGNFAMKDREKKIGLYLIGQEICIWFELSGLKQVGVNVTCLSAERPNKANVLSRPFITFQKRPTGGFLLELTKENISTDNENNLKYLKLDSSNGPITKALEVKNQLIVSGPTNINKGLYVLPQVGAQGYPQLQILLNEDKNCFFRMLKNDNYYIDFIKYIGDLNEVIACIDKITPLGNMLKITKSLTVVGKLEATLIEVVGSIAGSNLSLSAGIMCSTINTSGTITAPNLNVSGKITTSNLTVPNILGSTSFSCSSGNDFMEANIRLNGNGIANTIKPALGFHQPALYAGSLQMQDAAWFAFLKQGLQTYASLKVQDLAASGTVTGTNITASNALFTNGHSIQIV